MIRLPGIAMNEVALVTLFLAGLLGSTHCLAMCGGLAAALGAAPDPAAGHAGGPAARLRSPLASVLHQLGRIASYAMAGLIAGTLGTTGADWLSPHAGDYLRIATAMVVVLIGLRLALGAGAGTGTVMSWLRWPERLGARVWRMLAPLSRTRSSGPVLRPLLTGLVWGWMPCGLVYSALVAAVVSGSPARGAASMLAFGLGTVPAMLGVGLAGMWLPRADGPLVRLLGTGIVACGLWIAAVPIGELAGQVHGHHTIAWWGVPALDCKPGAAQAR